MDNNFEYRPQGDYQSEEAEDLDTRIAKALVGNNDKMYQKVMNTNKVAFNIFAVLFSIPYYVYRKCYLSALILYGAQMVLTTLFVALTGSTYMLTVLIWFAEGLVFYPLYYWEINRKKKKLRETGWSETEMLQRASYLGGTNIVGAVGFMIGLAILMII